MVILAELGLEALTGIYALVCGAPHLLKKMPLGGSSPGNAVKETLLRYLVPWELGH